MSYWTHCLVVWCQLGKCRCHLRKRRWCRRIGRRMCWSWKQMWVWGPSCWSMRHRYWVKYKAHSSGCYRQHKYCWREWSLEGTHMCYWPSGRYYRDRCRRQMCPVGHRWVDKHSWSWWPRREHYNYYRCYHSGRGCSIGGCIGSSAGCRAWWLKYRHRTSWLDWRMRRDTSKWWRCWWGWMYWSTGCTHCPAGTDCSTWCCTGSKYHWIRWST